MTWLRCHPIVSRSLALAVDRSGAALMNLASRG